MVLFLLIVFLVLLFFTLESNTGPAYSPNINKDGLILMDRPTADQVLEQLPEGYKFLNYRYTIEGCTLSTFHRDVTSSQYIFETKHPVYTFITYEYPKQDILIGLFRLRKCGGSTFRKEI